MICWTLAGNYLVKRGCLVKNCLSFSLHFMWSLEVLKSPISNLDKQLIWVFQSNGMCGFLDTHFIQCLCAVVQTTAYFCKPDMVDWMAETHRLVVSVKHLYFPRGKNSLGKKKGKPSWKDFLCNICSQFKKIGRKMTIRQPTSRRLLSAFR